MFSLKAFILHPSYEIWNSSCMNSWPLFSFLFFLVLLFLGTDLSKKHIRKSSSNSKITTGPAVVGPPSSSSGNENQICKQDQTRTNTNGKVRTIEIKRETESGPSSKDLHRSNSGSSDTSSGFGSLNNSDHPTQATPSGKLIMSSTKIYFPTCCWQLYAQLMSWVETQWVELKLNGQCPNSGSSDTSSGFGSLNNEDHPTQATPSGKSAMASKVWCKCECNCLFFPWPCAIFHCWCHKTYIINKIMNLGHFYFK